MLKPIKGHPGRFLEVGTGKVLRLSDYREGVKYDTIAISDNGGTGLTTPREYIFFRDVYAKSPIDCNFSQPAKINPGERMIIDRVGIFVHSIVGDYDTPGNVVIIGDMAHLRVEINRLLFVEGPAWSFPTGYGYTISDDYITMGPASQTLAGKMTRTQMLTDLHDIVGILSFGSRRWCQSVYEGEVTPEEMDTLGVEAPCFVKCILHGLIKDALTK